MELAMTRLTISIFLLTMIATGCNKASATGPKVADSTETKYVSFQVMTGLYGYAGPQPMPGHFALSKAQLEGFVHDLVKAIGATGDARHKLGFAVGPLCFDMSDLETRQFIHDSFAVARENDVAVAFHIDDSLSWGRRKDLLSNPDNIETADWKQQPSTGRRADWGPEPTRFPPQMCFNSPAIVSAVKDRAGLIGAEIERELAVLKTQGKEHLFAGVIAGWETQIGPGRHPISSAMFWYFKSPAGGLVEYYADEDVLTENWTPRDFTPSPEMFAEWAVVGGIDGTTRRQKQGA